MEKDMIEEMAEKVAKLSEKMEIWDDLRPYYLSVGGTEVFFAMSDQQAKQEKTYRCIHPALPDSDVLYYRLDKIPDDFCVEKELGWKKTLCVLKKNLLCVLEILYGKTYPQDILSAVDKIEGDYIWLIGFEDIGVRLGIQ